MLKFLYNGIKLDGTLYKGTYSKGTYTEQSKIPQGTITIYAKDYKRFPLIEGLEIKNNSDSMVDYFEEDKIRVIPTNKYYQEVFQAWEKQEEKIRIRKEKRLKKQLTNN
jgi:hypothetical protein